MTDLRALSFSDRGIFCSKCLMKNCLSGILQVLMCCASIFIQLEHTLVDVAQWAYSVTSWSLAVMGLESQ